ncbi:hypothetical protein FALCPG4_017411 [Fusarium falciforme]
MAIRQSSVVSHSRRARKHTEALDLSSFTQLASLSLKWLFATASAELREQLTASMTDTYRLFIYRRKKLETQTRQRSPRLPPIPEDATGEGTSEAAMQSQATFPDTASASHHHPAPPNSKPTTINTREALSRLGGERSAHRGAASILVSHVDYPRPAEGSKTCDWCFSPLLKDTLKGDNWRQHVNEDHRPFVCISEECMKSPSLPRFSTSSKWLQHMLQIHGTEWHRQVHTPSQWICPLCHDAITKFPSAEDLKEHLSNGHSKMALTGPQKETIVRQSQASRPRPQNVCPLCCLSIKEEQDSLQRKEKDGDNKRNAADQTAMVESEKKRLKARVGQKTTALPINESDLEASSSSTVLEPEVVARHIAGHLRTIMLLTLRIISIDGPVEISSDKESVSGKTDDQLSQVASCHGDLGDTSDIWATPSHLEEDLAEGYQLQDIEETAPEGDEAITWDHIHGEEDGPIDDFLHQAAEQGAFQSHSDEHKNRAAETLWISGSSERDPQEKAKRTLLDSKDAYHIAWRAFERLSEREQHLALRAFQWVLCSYQPLNTQQLSMVMLIDPDSDEVDELNGEGERLLRRGGINDLCGSLITFDKQTDIWRFKSLTAADYFKTTHCDIGKAFAFVTMACLKFLITDPCALNKTTCRCAGNATPSSELAIKQHPCTLIRSHTIRYIQETERSSTSHDERLAVLEKRFLGSPQFSSTAYQAWAETWGKIVLTNENYLKPVSSPLFAMAAFGLQRLLSDWWLDPETDLDICNAQDNSILNLASIHGQDAIRRVIATRNGNFWSDKPEPSPTSAQEEYSRHEASNQSASTSRYPGYSSGKRRSRHGSSRGSGRPQQELEPLSFLFIVNKLHIQQPEMDDYHNYTPPRFPDGYAGEVPSKVMRYSNGEVSEAFGYYWHRNSSDDVGYLFRIDASGNYIPDPSTGSYLAAQQYKTFAVFACNPLLPIMVTDVDPLVYQSGWDLLRIFHSRGIQSGLSQVVTLESPMALGQGPVRYVAGKSPSWVPGLIPETYRNPFPHAPASLGLGGELPVILGLMALNACPASGGENEANEVFLEKEQWRNRQWRGNEVPRGRK